MSTGDLAVMGDWLAVRVSDDCTCNGGGPECGGAHEPHCGWEPAAEVRDVLAALAAAAEEPAQWQESGQTVVLTPGTTHALCLCQDSGRGAAGGHGPVLLAQIARPDGHPFDTSGIALLDLAQVRRLHELTGRFLARHTEAPECEGCRYWRAEAHAYEQECGRQVIEADEARQALTAVLLEQPPVRRPSPAQPDLLSALQVSIETARGSSGEKGDTGE